ncbi:bacteriophage Gp15 family protein [Sutcliffiella horikoshii]|uniref:Gp15 family bacteriophage protein n=1 Tax=Sutcliffiella horikoshii TaxID=79883 RepID=UPI002041A70A|nr:Gp15 family bacteriophage protein [Sutcliffiella horikoshii]MCM3618753.1 bacteriophage Gp15 family protein [Sutcliffiella horikoshii]
MRLRLNDPLVTSFFYQEKKYTIDMAFDNVLDAFDVLGDQTLREQEKAEICLVLLLNESCKGEEAINLWNYLYERFIKVENIQPIEYDLKGKPLPVREEVSKNLISLEKDAGYIYASFQQAYNLNLFDQQGKLHWQEFQALLQGLPSDTIMQRIIQIRMWEPSKGETSEYKQAMKKLQNLYALDDGEIEEVD